MKSVCCSCSGPGPVSSIHMVAHNDLKRSSSPADFDDIFDFCLKLKITFEQVEGTDRIVFRFPSNTGPLFYEMYPNPCTIPLHLN